MTVRVPTSSLQSVPWKYRLAYLFLAWITINIVPKGTGYVTFLGAVIIYPFAMQYLKLHKGSFFENELAVLRSFWKMTPLWGKVVGLAVLFAIISPVRTSSHIIPEIITMVLLFYCVSFPFVRGKNAIRKGMSKIHDEV